MAPTPAAPAVREAGRWGRAGGAAAVVVAGAGVEEGVVMVGAAGEAVAMGAGVVSYSSFDKDATRWGCLRVAEIAAPFRSQGLGGEAMKRAAVGVWVGGK
jgi:hypothetical protein